MEQLPSRAQRDQDRPSHVARFQDEAQLPVVGGGGVVQPHDQQPLQLAAPLPRGAIGELPRRQLQVHGPQRGAVEAGAGARDESAAGEQGAGAHHQRAAALRHRGRP